MRIRDFQIGSEGIRITFRNSRKRYLYLDENSGKAYYRYKRNTLDQIMHTGIYLGHDERGKRYYIHNHTGEGYASVTTEKEFTQERSLYEHPKDSQFPPMEVLTRALEKAKEGEPYKLLTNNCQTFTNYSREGSLHSEDVLKWGLISCFSVTAIAGVITYLLTRGGKH